jgi:hypothetical protein
MTCIMTGMADDLISANARNVDRCGCAPHCFNQGWDRCAADLDQRGRLKWMKTAAGTKQPKGVAN